jgi:hypothetical protein
MVSKYDALGAYLRRQTGDRVPMTFAEVERVTGVTLPAKSQHSRAWWSNNPGNNVMTKVWLDAGFETREVDLKAHTVVFVRKGHSSPLWGALKGTFEIDPAWDLTKPTLSDEELAEWEASLDRKADRTEAGMEKKGMAETAHEYTPKEELPDHPLFGCMKGTFWIDPEWDWTKPALDPEELAEWEASLDRKFALFAQSKK